MKSIRTREEGLDELKRRRKSVAASADSAEKKLNKMSPEHKNLAMQTDTLHRLRDEIRQLDSDIMTEEARLGDFKRSTTRNLMGLKFGGLQELSAKGTIVGDFGKQIIAVRWFSFFGLPIVLIHKVCRKYLKMASRVILRT
jgi:DNA segregation ATPase FtsK/SpoIIIE-like protein